MSNFDKLIADVFKKEEEFGDEVPTYIDTGSYALNALISADIYKGYLSHAITCLAGEEATGKTFMAMQAIKNFLKVYPDGRIFYYDTEFAITNTTLSSHKIDITKVKVIRKELIEDIRNNMMAVIEAVSNMPEKDRKPLMFVLDSLGNTGTSKEYADILKKEDKADIQRAKVIKSLFRVTAPRLGKLNAQFIVTNHVYDNISGYGPKLIMGGGSGIKYMSSSIVHFSKSKDTDKDKNVNGIFIKANLIKSRFSKPMRDIELQLNFSTGLNRYWGLADLAVDAGIWKGLDNNRVELPDGSKFYQAAIYKQAERFFTKEVLDDINVYVNREYSLSGSEANAIKEQDEVEMNDDAEE